VVWALDCARAFLQPHVSRAIEPAIAHARTWKCLRVLKKVAITYPPLRRLSYQERLRADVLYVLAAHCVSAEYWAYLQLNILAISRMWLS
jgi:hypothetical protein